MVMSDHQDIENLLLRHIEGNDDILNCCLLDSMGEMIGFAPKDRGLSEEHVGTMARNAGLSAISDAPNNGLGDLRYVCLICARGTMIGLSLPDSQMVLFVVARPKTNLAILLMELREMAEMIASQIQQSEKL